MAHPGPNDLGRYFPPSKVNELLLADIPEKHSFPLEEVHSPRGEDEESLEEYNNVTVMDLASFLE